jgi:hypothetical protein
LTFTIAVRLIFLKVIPKFSWIPARQPDLPAAAVAPAVYELELNQELLFHPLEPVDLAMSQSIQSRIPWLSQFQQPDTAEEQLRSELGWTEVASGLGKVLYGYFLLAVNGLIVVGLLIYLISSTVAAKKPNAHDAILAMWIFYLGIGIVGLLSIYTYVNIFVGKCRCAIHAPERCGARWYIFACLMCIVIGPVLSIVNSVAAPTTVVTADKKEKLHQELVQQLQGQEGESLVLGELRRRCTVMQVISALVSLSTTIFFVLFLRAIANCFEEKRLIVMNDMYLIFSSMLLGYTIYMLTAAKFDQNMILVLIPLGAGGLISAGWYVAMLVYTRTLILTKVAAVRSPLEG